MKDVMVQAAQQIALQERALARQRDAEARQEEFAALVKRQSRFVFRIAYAVSRNVQDSEDVVQETFLKLYRTGAWQRMTDERAFLARTAWRLAVARLPKRASTSFDLTVPSGDISPENAIVQADWNATVHRLVDSLPDDLRLPLALSTIEEMSSRQIADVMGIPEGSVRTRLMRARHVLKEKLAHLMETRNAK
jgi:RNA polymerase sigma-70 factor (ECF subfamily)